MLASDVQGQVGDLKKLGGPSYDLEVRILYEGTYFYSDAL